MPEPKSLRSTLFLVALWAGVIGATIGSAAAGEWRLVNFSGDVRIQGASQVWVRAKPGQILIAGDSVWTSKSGRAQLASADGTVILRPKSLVKIPSGKLRDGMTVLFHGQGEVTVNVRKKRRTHFSIQTPFLAAVVKGTEFTVGSRPDHSRLSVKSGVVIARQTSTGRSTEVRAGQSVTVSDTGDIVYALNATGAQSGGHFSSSSHSGRGFFDGENLGNDDDPVTGRNRGGTGGNLTRNGDDCGGNCGNGQGNGGGNGTDNEGNGD